MGEVDGGGVPHADTLVVVVDFALAFVVVGSMARSHTVVHLLGCIICCVVLEGGSTFC
jgi:hypothetical protein